jgi:hypothetical protein
MALFTSYAPPGVYTSVVIGQAGQPLFGTNYIPVIIGEGVQLTTYSNVELHRGSSAVANDQVVQDISNQVTGLTNTFQLSYFPVVSNNGVGGVTNNLTDIHVTSGGVPVTVISLTGATGQFITHVILPQGSQLSVTYYFKKKDTLVTNENLTPQVPAFATFTVEGTGESQTGTLDLTLSIPGSLGNLVYLELHDAGMGAGVPDALAVSGAGTDNIEIELRDSATNGLRTLAQVQALVNAGIPTLSGGYLVAGALVGDSTDTVMAAGPTAFAGGLGPSSNTVFQVANVPIVDGTNGGVVVNVPGSYMTATVYGTAVAIAAVNGVQGLVTLAAGVPYGATLLLTYYTNTYQNTADLLPASNVADIQEVGLGPNRADFIQGVDYILSVDPLTGDSAVNWGNSAITSLGSETPGFTPFGPTQITTTLRDQKVWMRPCTLPANGVTNVFTLEDTPVDGSGQGRATDNPMLVTVYVGADPFDAYMNGPITTTSSPNRVIAVSGDSAQVTLYNAPSKGLFVYASYYRSILNSYTYALKVVAAAGGANQGQYNITDNLNRLMPVPSNGTDHVADSGFALTGIVWPYKQSEPDWYDNPGSIDEVITLTFNADGTAILVPAVSASRTLQGINFQASTPGAAGDAVTIAFTSKGSSDATAIVTTGDAVVVDITNLSAQTRTTAEIAALFTTYPSRATTTDGGVILATGGGTTQAQIDSAEPLENGADAVTEGFTTSYTVSSSQGSNGSAGTGYLGQTYIDAKTGATFTIVNPADALNYGYTQLPSPQYAFAPGDTLQIVFQKAATYPSYASTFYTGATINAIAGLWTMVSTTYGMNVGDTALIETYKLSDNGPAVGEYYYVTYDVAKTAADMALKIFTNSSDAYALYGQPTNPANRLSLGIQLLTQNGTQTFGAIQVPQQPGLGVASDQDFIAAIQSLTVPLPGTTQKANVIVPLSTSAAVQSFLGRQLITQATARYKGEALGFVGFAATTTASVAAANAQGLMNSRIIAVGNPVASIQLTDPTTGVAQQYALSGEFMAAALAGMNADPANDPATTLTNQDMVGFENLLVRFDDPTMDMMAAAGLTMLVELNGNFVVRHYKSTDPSNPITSEPTSTTSVDYTRQAFRNDIKQFIGRKLTDSLVGDVQVVCNARLASLVSQEILSAYQNLSVIPDPSDPTTVDVSVDVMPMFSLLYVNVTFTVVTNLPSNG